MLCTAQNYCLLTIIRAKKCSCGGEICSASHSSPLQGIQSDPDPPQLLRHEEESPDMASEVGGGAAVQDERREAGGADQWRAAARVGRGERRASGKVGRSARSAARVGEEDEKRKVKRRGNRSRNIFGVSCARYVGLGVRQILGRK